MATNLVHFLFLLAEITFWLARDKRSESACKRVEQFANFVKFTGLTCNALGDCELKYCKNWAGWTNAEKIRCRVTGERKERPFQRARSDIRTIQETIFLTVTRIKTLRNGRWWLLIHLNSNREINWSTPFVDAAEAIEFSPKSCHYDTHNQQKILNGSLIIKHLHLIKTKVRKRRKKMRAQHEFRQKTALL